MVGITEKYIHKTTKSEAKIKGNISQSRNKSQLTTTNMISGEEQFHSDSVQEPYNNKTELMIATVEETHKIYTDQPEKSPITSSQGNKYILIMYVYGANTIIASPLKSRSGSHIL